MKVVTPTEMIAITASGLRTVITTLIFAAVTIMMNVSPVKMKIIVLMIAENPPHLLPPLLPSPKYVPVILLPLFQDHPL